VLFVPTEKFVVFSPNGSPTKSFALSRARHFMFTPSFMEHATIADGENDHERPLASELLQKLVHAKSGALTVIGN